MILEPTVRRLTLSVERASKEAGIQPAEIWVIASEAAMRFIDSEAQSVKSTTWSRTNN